MTNKNNFVGFLFAFLLLLNLLFTTYVWYTRPTKESMQTTAKAAVQKRETDFVNKYGKVVNQMQEEFGLTKTEIRTLDDILMCVGTLVEGVVNN